MNSERQYHIHISADSAPMGLNLKEVWRYRDLIWLFTKRSFKLVYKQTVLGPLWIVIRPLLTAVIYTVIFGRVAGLSTGGVPKLLFYLCSHTLWTFFADCLNNNSSTFITNANVFGKVYFPRLTIPISTVLSAGIQFIVQMVIVCALIIWHALRGNVAPHAEMLILVIPVLLVTGLMGLGLGILVSSVTTKYRDLMYLVGFGLLLWMYVSPVVYPLSQASGWFYRILILNPMTAPMELFRYILLGTGEVPAVSVVSSLIFTAAAVICGALIFNRVERTFIDTV